MIAGIETEGWTPVTAEEKAAVEQELGQLLKDPSFSQSRRYPQFLRFVVSHSLEVPDELLKERTLGHQIFGKMPGYDTASDPIVRVTATEIRKRLANYYQGSDHRNGIRIVLPLGSYSPKFYLPDMLQPIPVETLPAQSTTTLAEPQDQIKSAELPDFAAIQDEPYVVPKIVPERRQFRWTILCVVMLGFMVAGAVCWRLLHVSRVSAFWSPLLSSSSPVLVCLPDLTNNLALPLGDATDPAKLSTVNVKRNEAAMSDLQPLIDVVQTMQAKNKAFHLKGTTSTSLDDLRQGPAVLIGAFVNPWTLRLTEPMRFHFANDPGMTELWIADRENTASRYWTRSTARSGKEGYYEDYALLVRFLDADTGQYVIVVAGLGHGGTIAAGEFLTSERDIDQLMRLAPQGWKGQNLEAVLKTTVAGEQAGAPHVVATYFW